MHLVFDIGGTNMRIAVSEDGKKLGEIKVLQTPINFQEAISIIKNTAFELSKGEKITAAAGGVRALDKSRQRLVDHPIIPLWVNEPLHDELQKAFNAPVYLENDAAMVGLGEATFGVGRGYRIVAYITISTGIGGVRIVDGKIDNSSMGFEPGHQILMHHQSDDERFSMLKPTYWEELVSGHALQKRHNKLPQDINDQTIWSELEEIVAVGLNNVAVLWSPDIIILGGSLIKKMDVKNIEEKFLKLLKIFPQRPAIVQFQLGEQGGLLGALKYLNPNLFSS